jgi:hypothetical protein
MLKPPRLRPGTAALGPTSPRRLQPSEGAWQGCDGPPRAHHKNVAIRWRTNRDPALQAGSLGVAFRSLGQAPRRRYLTKRCCSPHLGQPAPPRGSMPRRGSLGFPAKRRSPRAVAGVGSFAVVPTGAGAVALRVAGRGSRARLPPHLRHDVRDCSRPRRLHPFFRPVGSSERRGRHPFPPRRFRARSAAGSWIPTTSAQATELTRFLPPGRAPSDTHDPRGLMLWVYCGI